MRQHGSTQTAGSPYRPCRQQYTTHVPPNPVSQTSPSVILLVNVLSPAGLDGLSTWKKPPSKSTVSVFFCASAWGCVSWRLGSGVAAAAAAIAAFSASAACCLAFMAAFTAARRDLAAALVPAGLAGAGAAAGFCQDGAQDMSDCVALFLH